jgi:hypothetical protein
MKENYTKTQISYSVTHLNQFKNYAQGSSCMSFVVILVPILLSQVLCQFREKINTHIYVPTDKI